MSMCVDHVVVLVDGLDDARQTYERLGFSTRPVSRHESLGSANSVIHLHSSYVELFTLGEAGEPLRSQYAPRLRFGPGLANVSVQSVDLELDRARLLAAGIPAEPVRSARRKVEQPDGSQDETDSSFFYSWRHDHRYLSIFHTCHGRPHTLFVPEYAVHANTAAELVRTVWISADPEVDHDYFAALFGVAPHVDPGNGFMIRDGRGHIAEVLSLDAARSRYGAHLSEGDPTPIGGLPVALHYAVTSIDACRRVLAQNSVMHTLSLDARQVAVAANFACGVVTLFEEP